MDHANSARSVLKSDTLLVRKHYNVSAITYSMLAIQLSFEQLSDSKLVIDGPVVFVQPAS